MPYNLFDEFVEACGGDPEKVLPKYDALQGARNTYKLNTKEELLEFINNGGLEDQRHFDIEEWRHNPEKATNPLYAYDYSCAVCGRPRCYMAIIFAKTFKRKNNLWMMKSFKRDDGTKDYRRISPPSEQLEQQEDI